MSTGGAYLRIDHVSKSFGAFQALCDVSLEIQLGEFVCFLGPSGCGKTTLLRAIAGLDIQTSGHIFQGGRDISALPPAQRDFGIVFQSYALFPNLTVAENVAYGLVSTKRPKAEIDARVAELVALVGLRGQEPKFPGQLSGGQQQRVALARALAMSPGLLLLDEPLSALDARVRQHLRGELKDLQRKLKVTTIMVTHDQEEALAIADRIVVMNQGVIEQVGTPMDVYRHPKTAFVADFVGQMNFLPVERVAPDRVRYGAIDFLTPHSEHAVPADGKSALCVRPEDIQIRNVGADQHNTLKVKIDHMEFLGSFCRAELVVDGGRHLKADFSINAMRDLALQPGQEITIALPQERLRLFQVDSHV
jgi:iron(III) transport system ATP-binding protein